MTTDQYCPACGCKLVENPIRVMIGERAMEVCCEECAQQLRDAQTRRSTPIENAQELA